jgi:hypothetical protein
MTDDELLQIKRRAEKSLLAIPGVHAVGIGSKVTKGSPTGEPSIRVFVVRKKPPGDVPPDDLVPSEIEGVKTDVVETPVPTTQQILGEGANAHNEDEDRYRPLRGGTQINRIGRGNGTLGCFLTVNGDAAKVVAVTNHHVLYENSSDSPNHEQAGQPTGEDSCTKCCSDVIGTVLDAQCDADVDIALVQLQGGEKWLREVQDIGTVKGTHTVTLAEATPHTYQVKKRGRTTRLTGGFVTDIGMSGSVNKPDGSLHRNYVDAIRVEANPDPANPGPRAFAKPGDSGSAVLNTSDEVVGILFGAGATTGLVIPIQKIIDKFATGVAAPRRIALAVATATTLNDVQTIPAASAVAPAGLPEAEAPDLAAAFADEPRVLRGARLQLELGESQIGQLWTAMYHRHSPEIRGLLATSRRFATLWQRSGGAALFQCLVRAFHNPGLRVPETIDGRAPRQCADAVAAGLLQYGSPELKRDLHRLLPNVPDVAGRTYAEILESLKALDPTVTSQTA